MRTARQKLTYSNLMATVAVFLTLGGTAFAAAKIDGSQIRDGSVTGRDLRDRSVGRRDLKPGTLPVSTTGQGDRGPAGPQGERGAAGPIGETGPAGPSDGFVVRGESRAVIGDQQRVFDFELPAGNWLMTATGALDSFHTRPVEVACRLEAEDAGLIVAESGVTELGGTEIGLDRDSFAMTGAIELPRPARITLACESQPGFTDIEHPVVTGVKAGNLTPIRPEFF